MKKVIVLLAMVAMFATSCSMTSKSMREALVKFDLNSSDYVLSQPVSGQATVVLVFGIDWARLFNQKIGNFSYPIVGSDILMGLNTQYAIYDLMEKNPGYDFVMYPQFVVKESGVKGLFTKADIKVTARLGKLK